MFQNVMVVSAVRTAVGSFGGSLKDFETTKLGEIAIRAAVERAGIAPDCVEEVILGCVGQYGLNGFLARIAALNAGLSIHSSAQTVNRLCASGLQAVVTGATAIDHRDMDIVVAGGAESMSNFPYCSYQTRFGARMGDIVTKDALTTALAEPFTGTHIAMTAENIAEKFGFTREQVDAYALESQRRARAAIEAGKFREQIIPVEVKEKKATRIFDTDEHPRDTSMEKLGKLKPIFKKDGLVTAGNASGINDAAAAMVLMHGDKAREMGITPIARVVDYALAGVDPNYMGLGPIDATRKLFERTGLSAREIDLFELNEAFASQAMACIQELGLDGDKVNVNGSGISLGHPIGATGAVISVKLLYELERIGGRYGIATLCIGGGQGLSVLYENLR